MGWMPPQAIPYRLYLTPFTGPDLRPHSVPAMGLGATLETAREAWKSCPYEGAGEGRRLAMFVRLLLLSVNLSSSFYQGCQAIAQRARAAGAAGAAGAAPCQRSCASRACEQG